MPTANWKGMGTEGGGFSGGSGSFALDPNGRLNWQLIRENATSAFMR